MSIPTILKFYNAAKQQYDVNNASKDYGLSTNDVEILSIPAIQLDELRRSFKDMLHTENMVTTMMGQVSTNILLHLSFI